MSDLANPFFSRVVCAAEAAAAAWGYALVVFNSDEKPENERRILARIRPCHATASCLSQLTHIREPSSGTGKGGPIPLVTSVATPMAAGRTV